MEDTAGLVEIMGAVEHNLGIDMQNFGRLKTKLQWIERVDPQKVKAFVYEDRAQLMEGKHAKLRQKFDMVRRVSVWCHYKQLTGIACSS